MNIKKRISKFISLLLSFTITFGNVIPAYATENTSDNSTTVIDGENISTEERNLEDITVTYKQASSFFVTIPKTIVLDGWKQSTYSVKVSGDIDAEQCVYVAPVDGIADTENIDFYMKDQATENAKDDVVANVTHKKSHWNAAEVAAGYKQADNLVKAPDLTAGAWRGIFQMEIKLETHVIHKHNYVAAITKEPTCTEAGEKTYTCNCGHSYTEEIPAKGHHFEDGECTDCGEKDPNASHEHNYVDGKCECGAIDPNHTHNYGEDGKCTICGKENDPYETAPASAYSNWDYTLDDENGIITLNYYKGSETDVIVYANYIIDGKSYKTQIASNVDESYIFEKAYVPYMFNGLAQENCKNIKSITFSDAIDTSNVINMNYMFYDCEALNELDVSGFDTSNVTNMCNMFDSCKSLTDLDLNNFNTSNVTNMGYMFNGCEALIDLGISCFDTSNVTNMRYMFCNCRKLADLNVSRFNTKNVTDMQFMFYGCDALTSLGISNFDTSNVTNMSSMFGFCKSLTTLNLSNFNTSNVTNMEYMFYDCIALESLNVSSFDTSKVTNMRSMFCDNWKVGYLDVSRFDTSKVTDMGAMFFNCQSITGLDLSNFNTSNVTMMGNMFYNCRVLRTIYATRGKWSTSQANTTDMFKNCGTSSVTYK